MEVSEGSSDTPVFLCTGNTFDLTCSFQASNFTGIKSEICFVTSALFLIVLTFDL